MTRPQGVKTGQWLPQTMNTRAHLGCVTPLGWPRSVYKSGVECHFLSRNGQMTMKVKVNDPNFQYMLREYEDAYLVILAQIHYKLSLGQTKFPWILSQDDQNDLEGPGQWPPFSIPTKSISRCMSGANLVILAKICDELCGQAKFPRILSQNGQKLSWRSMTPIFNINGEYPMMHVWHKFSDSSSNLWWVIVRTR